MGKLTGNIKQRKAIIDHICKPMEIAEPLGYNAKIWKKKLTDCTDEEFDYFMSCIRDGSDCLHMDVPNLAHPPLQYEDIEKAADSVNTSFYHHLKIKDHLTGIEFITPEKYMVIQQCQRRQQQTIYAKLSVPTSDKKIDGFTGQVTGDDRAASLTNPEAQAIQSQGNTETLKELLVSRGGNISAYVALKQAIEETGSGSLQDTIDPDSVARSTIVLDTYLLSMGYQTNLLDKS